MNENLFFFCSTCKNKPEDELEQTHCNLNYNIKNYKRGEYIAYQGDNVSSLLILNSGKVKTEMVSDSGLSIPIENISAPYPLAAAFIFADKNKFPVDVIALEDCQIIVISKESLEKQMATCPSFLRGFLAFNANRMQFLSERLKIFSQRGIKPKMAYYILQRSKQGNFTLDRSISSLAEYFGVERPSLSRAISEMNSDGIIELKAGNGKIKDYNKLKEVLG